MRNDAYRRMKSYIMRQTVAQALVRGKRVAIMTNNIPKTLSELAEDVPGTLSLVTGPSCVLAYPRKERSYGRG